MKEVPLQFGEGQRLFGILTIASEQSQDEAISRAFVFLNSGLLHRVGPRGLHVRLARELAGIGVNSLRVDLAGIGDSPARAGVSVPESVAIDVKEIISVLESNLGAVSVVLVGLCSGADNAIFNVSADPRVVGLVLMDPVCDTDAGFKVRARKFEIRAFLKKSLVPSRYLNWIKRRLTLLTSQASERSVQMNILDLRNIPTNNQMRKAFESIRDRDGRVLSIFTSYAMQYYNVEGQLGRVLEIDRYADYCEEVFWPEADHTYSLESHRKRLIKTIKAWAARTEFTRF